MRISYHLLWRQRHALKQKRGKDGKKKINKQKVMGDRRAIISASGQLTVSSRANAGEGDCDGLTTCRHSGVNRSHVSSSVTPRRIC